MNRLQLRFLGYPEVHGGGQLLKFPTRKALALLAYLALEERWHSREKLVAWLWPDSDRVRGQAALRNTLLRLRRALGEADRRLLIDRDLLAFDLDGVELDLQGVVAALGAEDSTTPQPLLEAVSLYRGDFLAGFNLPDAPAFDEWAGRQREYWHQRMSSVFERLSRLQAYSGQRREALATATRWTAHDPLSEVAYRRLMMLHLAGGDRSVALQVYETCRQLLADELGVPPSPETEALAEQIHEGQTAGFEQKTPRSGVVASFTTHPAFFEMPFVGRAAKHRQLVRAFHAGRQGETQAVVVEGEAGIGKTRLLDEFCRWAAAQGGDVLLGRAFEAGDRLPYQPLVDALRPRIERENAPEDLLSDVWLAELSRLLPELRDRYPDLPRPAGAGNVARTRLLEGIARLGQALAGRRRPIVLVVDDLQWADSATLDTLHYCGRDWREKGLPILLLFAVRSESLTQAPSLSEWMVNLQRALPVRRFGLGPLSARDIDEIVRMLGQYALPESDETRREGIMARFGQWLFTETAGHAFFLAEMLKALMEQGTLRWQVGPGGQQELDIRQLESWLATTSATSLLPQSVQQLIETRLNRLPPDAAALLAAAAVLGRRASYLRLCQVAALDEGAALSAFDELLKGHLLVESPDPRCPHAIAHDKTREVVYDALGAARRQLFHRRALATLEADAAPAAELAHHALRAGLPERACRQGIAAGQAALSLFAIQEAIDHYEQVRALLPEQAAATGQELWPPLYLGLGRAYELAGELQQAAELYREMQQMAEASGQPELVCRALNRQATVAVQLYDFEAALAYLRQAALVAEGGDDKTGLAETEWNLAQLYHHRFDFRQSLLHSRRTVTLARELSDEALLASSLNSVGYAQLLLGQLDEGELTMAQARATYVTLGNRALEADCLTALAAAHVWQGRLPEAIETAGAAEAICAEIENPWGHIYSRVWLATALLNRGDYEAALTVAQTGQAQAKRHDLLPMSIFITLILGQVYRALGQADSAYQVHWEALALNERLQSAAHAEWIASELCADCALAENWEEAAGHAQAALRQRRYNSLPLIIPARWPETTALLRAGERELALEDVQRWGELVDHIPRFGLAHLRALAVLATWDGDTDGAIGYLEEALRLAEEIGLPGEVWPALAALAERYAVAGDTAQAEEAEDRASAIVADLAERMSDETLRQKFLTTVTIGNRFG